MRIVFYGSPEAALPALERLLRAGHRIALVITQPDKPAGRGKALTPPAVKSFASSRGIPVVQPANIRQSPETLDRMRDMELDAGVVVAYGQIIPGPLFRLPRLGTINLHFSLLPAYRGASPVAWAIIRGDTRTGVTIIELNEKMDEGDILSQEEAEILPRETAGELEARLSVLGADLLAEVLNRLPETARRPQNHSLASYAPKIRKEDGRLDWRLEAQDVDRRVRAFTPRPSAFTTHKGRRLIILKGRPVADSSGGAEPGTILRPFREGIPVACGRGVFLIEVLQPENRKPMAAYQYILGARVEEKEPLGS